MSEIDPRKNAWLEHKATRECLDGLGAVPPCELDFQRGWNAHASHTAAIREKAEALVAVNPVSVYRDKIVEYICEDDFDFTKILEEVEHEGEKYCDISQDGAFALVDYFLNLMEKVNEWRSEDAGQNYDFLHGKAELEKGNV